MSTAGPSGIEFGPNASGKRYLSLFRHRGSGAPGVKSCWLPAVPPPDEYAIFCTSDSADWRDAEGHYWGVRGRRAEVLGTGGERLAKFPRTTNDSDPWHGFPITLIEGRDRGPDDQLITLWIDSGVIDDVTGSKVRRRKL